MLIYVDSLIPFSFRVFRRGHRLVNAFTTRTMSLTSLRKIASRQSYSKTLVNRSCARLCSSTISWPDRILSGIQPTGVLHIGNYFGAVKNWVDLQNNDNDMICAIVDLHSMTLPYDPQQLPKHITLMTACLLGCGINPEKSTLFLQSEVPQHTQLCWMLSTETTLRRLARLPQYTEKSTYLTNTPLGLLWYPVLQAADILIYRATQVPVGKDQIQHLQLASSLARKFNCKFGETFPIPRPLLNNDNVARIRDLQDPTRKMSKSCADANSRIEIIDSPDIIASKLRLAFVECDSKIVFSPTTKPGVSNLVAMHAVLTGRETFSICEEFGNYEVDRYKETVTEALVETLKPIQKEIERLLKNKDYVISTLKNGSRKAQEIAAETWKIVTKKTGLDFSPT